MNKQKVVHTGKAQRLKLNGERNALHKFPLASTSDDVTSVVHAFEVDNAKQLSVEKTVSYFVPPEGFVSLFSGKNHILLGSRGSGKTTWVRMLAHDHMVLAAKQPDAAYSYARDALRRNIIGIYVPTNIGLVGSLKNKPWQDEESAELFFQWRLNLHSCAAIIPIIRSCIDHYISDPVRRTITEATICKDLSKIWSRSQSQVTTLDSLKLLSATIEAERVDHMSLYRAQGKPIKELNDYFDCELFHPIRYAIQVITHHVGIPPDALWMLCIDEAEYLTEGHHRILNTHLRTAAGNLVFKIATMPFAHHTLATNAADPVREGHDFDYAYVDYTPIDSRGAQDDSAFLRFAREVFKRRFRAQSQDTITLTLGQMLGPSPLIDEKTVETQDEIDDFMALLNKFANSATVARAERLLQQDKKKFRNEILRKMHGALVLREALQNKTGNNKLRLYTGEAMIVRCSDGNARRLMRLLNALLKTIGQAQRDQHPIRYPITPRLQNEVIEMIAYDALHRVQSEPPSGLQTYQYLMAVGSYMQRVFGARSLGSDFVSSISVHQDDGPHIQEFVKQAVQLSLLTPSRENARNGPNEPCEGVFHLAFLFAPIFGLLPRRNKAQRLPKILSASNLAIEELPHRGSLEI
jgi:hypothetical protein